MNQNNPTRNKFKIDYGEHAPNRSDWLTGPAIQSVTPDSISIEFSPDLSASNKSILANQDTILGGLFVVLILFAVVFLFKVSGAILSGTAQGDETKTAMVMIVFIVVGVLSARHFFTKSPPITIADIELAKIRLDKDHVSYQYKFKNHVRTWEEPLSRFNAVSIRLETMSGSGLELAGPATISYEHVNVIYLQHSTDDAKSLPLQIVSIEQDALSLAGQFASFTRKPTTTP